MARTYKSIGLVVLSITLILETLLIGITVHSTPTALVTTDEEQELLKAYEASGHATIYKVFIKSPNGDMIGSGTGFIVKYNEKVYLVTNSHVCFPAGVNVVDIGGDPKLVSHRKRSHKADLCVAKVNHILSLPYLTLTDSVPKEGEDLYSVGFPDGEYGGAFLKFINIHEQLWVTGFKQDQPDPDKCDPDSDLVGTPLDQMCLTETPMAFNRGRIIPGASGSPVFNADGDVVGVVAGTVGPYSVFVPAAKLIEFLNEEFPK